MVICKFVVGEKEKHEVEVDTGRSWFFQTRPFAITIDGKAVVKKLKWVKLTDKYRATIGSREKHELEITVRYPLHWHGMAPVVEALVDGKLHFKNV